MKLKDKYIASRPWGEGVPYEIWDMGDGYLVYVTQEGDVCGFGIHSPEKIITHEVAKYFGIEIDFSNLSFDSKGKELYLVPSIDSVRLNYIFPKKYQEILSKIEEIVNEHFKNKEKK